MEPKPEVASCLACLRPNPRRKQPSGEGNIRGSSVKSEQNLCLFPHKASVRAHTHTATKAGPPGLAKDSVVLDGPNSAPGERGLCWTSSMPSVGKRGAFLSTSQAPFRKHAEEEEEETSDSLTPSAASGGTDDVTSAARKALGEEVPARQGFGA